MNDNYGVVIGDNSRIEAPVAGGTNAHASSGVVAPQQASELELQTQIDTLLTALDAAVASGALSPDVRETGEEVRDQLDRSTPNKHVLASLLEGIATAAGSVQAVTSAVEAVKALVMTTL